jgi:hypothetical protein
MTRKKYTADDKIRIVLEGLRGRTHDHQPVQEKRTC